MKRTIIFLTFTIYFVSTCYSADKKTIITSQGDSIQYNRPQTPKPPFPYLVEDVSFFNRDKSIQFGGTFTTPATKGKHPVAILISGTGQNDRDVTCAGHKLFWVIADHLTRYGIAVLRIDDRGIGASSGQETVKDATSYDFAMDIVASIDFLKSQESIDTLTIGLIGHSGGSTIASIIGAERKDIAFIVSMAGVGVSFVELYIAQTRTNLQRLYPTNNIENILKLERSILDIIKAEKDNKIAEQKIHELYLSKYFIEQDSITHAFFNFKIDSTQTRITISNYRYSILLTPWYRHSFELNPEITYQQISAPFLAINGEKDKQVFADQNLNGFTSIFDKCGKTNYRIIKYPGLNHMFQHCDTGYSDEMASIDETISNDVLVAITNWIHEQIKEGNNTP